MSGGLDGGGDSDAGIAQVAGVPRGSGEEQVSRRDFLLWNPFKDWLLNKLEKCDGLAEAFIEAKVAQETNAARKTLEEAGEIAARREEIEARTGLVNQQCMEQFAKNLEDISDMSPFGQAMALAKLIELNPQLAKQLDKVERLLHKLQVTRGVSISNVPTKQPAGRETH